ncbi:ABC transporter ATP-binding protein [Pseudactinotalea sp.]|uniref:ABC transporter ATP-binding protein n=1 Tax=Pseudactinotalea sp. TaxID=1926260 RepID=UPI003B3A1514
MPTLKANDLYLTYGDGYIFDGLSIAIDSGQPPVGLIGPSGVGKTTLIAALSGQLKVPRGTVTFDGRPVNRLRLKSKSEFNARVRAVSQYSMTVSDPRLTADRRLRDAKKIARRGGRSHATLVEDMLIAVGMDPEAGYRPMLTLSGGERQRVALATALATRPEILLLDEPLTALDPHSRGAMARHLGDLIAQLGIGVLLASHDLELVERLCPTVHAMADGTIVASGALSEILSDPENESLKELAAAAPLAVQRFR